MLDSSLSLHQHTAKVTSTCFFHLRRLRKLSCLFDIDARKRLVCALILTRADYCNSALVGLPDSAFARLQRVLHAAARFVLALRPRDHISSALQTLHWLPVRQRITYKLCVLMHVVAFKYAPAYLLDAVVLHSLCCQEEHICGRPTVDSTTSHGHHRLWDPKRSPSRARKPGINFPYLCVTLTVLRLLSDT